MRIAVITLLFAVSAAPSRGESPSLARLGALASPGPSSTLEGLREQAAFETGAARPGPAFARSEPRTAAARRWRPDSPHRDGSKRAAETGAVVLGLAGLIAGGPVGLLAGAIVGAVIGYLLFLVLG